MIVFFENLFNGLFPYVASSDFLGIIGHISSIVTIGAFLLSDNITPSITYLCIQSIYRTIESFERLNEEIIDCTDEKVFFTYLQDIEKQLAYNKQILLPNSELKRKESRFAAYSKELQSIYQNPITDKDVFGYIAGSPFDLNHIKERYCIQLKKMIDDLKQEANELAEGL